MSFFKSLDRNEKLYWIGQALLFAGLALSVSVATALTVCGAVITAEASIASYLSAYWTLSRKG